MIKLRMVTTTLCAGALAVPFLLSQAPEADAEMTSQVRSGTAQAAEEALRVDYESGNLNSGVEGLSTTHATAPDASAVVRPGHGGSYAVQHKVTLGDPAYESNGAPRSESATDLLEAGQFNVGDVQRYEFSVLLKDWKPYEPGDSESGDIIFQGKYAGGNVPAFYLMTKRNEVAFRSPHLNKQTTVVPDLRPYINKWMNFRVDARWTTDETGYFKVSAQLPGQADYTQIISYNNVRTYQPENPAEHGYIKWGLYRPSESIANGDVSTRIVQHDDIRIFDLS
ncbi:heparin lyase I family protein [Streptomyces sp. NBC_01474]|uniref:heparin lyase I family protein n=1 Tax=Streptomyces sp. NBC_01474 TaxID=2903880 RepID=UPI002DD9B7E5|nr:heparin lyase I family protein [Streptomyces sp. NBC_01474]